MRDSNSASQKEWMQAISYWCIYKNDSKLMKRLHTRVNVVSRITYTKWYVGYYLLTSDNE